jgi:predicted enzyme related to lactoylglutathione lyase
MAEVKAHRPGGFCWIELGTPNAASAKRFYCELFGWTPVDVPIGPDAVYTMLQKNGKDVGALYQLGKAQLTLGVPAHWLSYVAVASVNEAAKRAKELGATLRSDPFDVMQAGRMAVLLDPAGAALALWQPGKHIGSALVNEPGSVGWTHLWTTNTDAALSFYAALFDWTRELGDTGGSPYTVFRSGDARVGGMTALATESDQTPARWLTYFAVESCDGTAHRANEIGGQIVVPPADVPTIGRFAALCDREGAAFGVIELSG